MSPPRKVAPKVARKVARKAAPTVAPVEPIEPSTLFMVLAVHPEINASGLTVRDVTAEGQGFRITAKSTAGDVFLFKILPREDGTPWQAPGVIEESVKTVLHGALRVRAARQGLVMPDEHGRFPDGEGVVR